MAREQAARRKGLALNERDQGTLRLFLWGHGLMGALTIALGVYTLTNDALLIEFTDILLTTLDSSYRGLWKLALVGPIIAGVLVITMASLANVLARVHAQRGRAMSPSLENTGRAIAEIEIKTCDQCCGSTGNGAFRTSVITLTIMFFLQIILSVGYLIFLQSLEASVQTIATSEAPLDAFQADVSTLQLSIFNLCCFEEGWSSQGKIEPCDPARETPLDDCSLPLRTQPFAANLCTCYPSDSYQAFYQELAKTRRVCQVLSQAVVDVTEDDLVPGTGLSITAVVPVRRTRIVGFNGKASDAPSSDLDPRGYGCGFGGYAKPFQWAQFKYASAKSEFVAAAMISISIVELIILAFIVCLLRSAGDDEFFDDLREEIVSERKRGRLAAAASYVLDSPRRLIGAPRTPRGAATALSATEAAISVSGIDLEAAPSKRPGASGAPEL